MNVMPNEEIGRCEWCGLVDHHLVDQACPKCTKEKGLRGPELRQTADELQQELRSGPRTYIQIRGRRQGKALGERRALALLMVEGAVVLEQQGPTFAFRLTSTTTPALGA